MVVYHAAANDTSAATLDLLHRAGVEPHVIEPAKCPPRRMMIRLLAERAGVPVRALVRPGADTAAVVDLAAADLTDDHLLDVLTEHPALIDGPIVVTAKGARLCRTPEQALDLLSANGNAASGLRQSA
ncbi:ArsC/Spx/MgsR family protein [Xanthobacteraceae bacterium A53D]